MQSYWQVKRRYDNTKPMVSKYHKLEDDLRPAGKRSRKWEHIVKLSPTCYALCDGGYGDPNFGNHYYQCDPIPTSISDTYNLSPIVWEIQPQPDGSYLETVKVRNGSGNYAHTSRYQFLAAFLPKSLRYNGGANGRQYIAVTNPDKLREVSYYLPKSRSVDAAQWGYYANNKNSQPDTAQREDDHKHLVFAREVYAPDAELMEKTGVLPICLKADSLQPWKLISPEFKVVHPKHRVDKVRKKELKPHLDAFWDWGCAVGPMLPIDDWRYIREVKNELRESNVIEGSWGEDYVSDNVQHILTTSDHELRLPLLAMFMLRSDMKHATTPEDAKKARAQFNRWANRVCGLVTTTKGE